MKRGGEKEPSPSPPRWRDRLRTRPCSSAGVRPQNELAKLEALSQRLAARFATFNKLFLKEVLCGRNDNAAASPLSCMLPLAMLHAGARGDTASALTDVLGFGPENKAANDDFKQLLKMTKTFFGGELSIANKVLVANKFPLRRAFNYVLRDVFESSAVKVNFCDRHNTTTLINEWVSLQTKGKINNLFTPNSFDQLTSLLVVNTVYLKGLWRQPFLKEKSTNDKFHVSLQQTVNVHFMNQVNDFHYVELKDMEADLISLPYQGQGDLRMLVVLPKQIDGLASLQQQLATRELADLLQGTSKVEVRLSLPKFEIETTLDLKQNLANMGLGQIFTDEANFSGITTAGEPLKVSNVIQKVYVKIDELGTEAAAATADLLPCRDCAPWMKPEPIEFNCNHPFMFLIVLGPEAIIIAGCVARPSPTS